MYPGRGVCGSVSLGETVWTCVDGPCKAGTEGELRSEEVGTPGGSPSTDEEYEGRY